MATAVRQSIQCVTPAGNHRARCGGTNQLPAMLLVFGEIPITAWLLGKHLGERWWSRAYGLQYLLSLGVGVATVPLITALYRSTSDQTALFVLLAACSATILATTFLVPGRRELAAMAAATS